jgi:hypothetical protein
MIASLLVADSAAHSNLWFLDETCTYALPGSIAVVVIKQVRAM